MFWGFLKTPVLLDAFFTWRVLWRTEIGWELRARALWIGCVIMKFCATQRWMEDCFPSLFWICFSAAIWSEALALFRKLSLLISLHRPCSNCFKRIFNLFQTAKVSLDFKRLSASLNDKWINSERELWRWKRAGNKWRSTCLNCKSKNWNVFSTLFKQFLIVLIRCCAFFAYCCYFFFVYQCSEKRKRRTKTELRKAFCYSCP